jgi:post-segregation antitoxin (ccd killing protein)
LSTELKLTLPDNLAREAEASGLLTPEAIESLLREEIRRRRVNQLFEAADRLANLDMPPLTETEVEAEIEAARQSRRTSDASSR